MGEGIIGGMWLGFGDFTEKRQIAYAAIDFLLDEFFGELSSTERSTKVWSSIEGDVVISLLYPKKNNKKAHTA